MIGIVSDKMYLLKEFLIERSFTNISENTESNNTTHLHCSCSESRLQVFNSDVIKNERKRYFLIGIVDACFDS